MSNKKIVLTGEFRVSGSDGEEATVNKHTELMNDSTFGNSKEWTEGLDDYKFSDGSRANKLSDTEFQRVSDGAVFSVISEQVLTE